MKKKRKEKQNLRARGLKSIKKSLLQGVIGLCVSICILFGLITSMILYSNANSEMTARVNESVSAYSESVKNAIANYKSKAQAIAQDGIIADDSKLLSGRLAEMSALAKKYGFEDVTVTDASGKTAEGEDVSQTDYFQKAVAGETYVSSTVKDSNSRVLLKVATKVNKSSAVVICSMSSKTFSQIIDNVNIGGSGYGFIVDGSGKIIADKNQDNVSNFVNYMDLSQQDASFNGLASVVKSMTDGEQGTQIISGQDGKCCVGYAAIPDTDHWSMAVSVGVNDMMGAFYRSILVTVGLTAVFILLSVMLAFQIANPIVNPILLLIKRIELLAGGDLHTEVPKLNTKSELGVLAQSFERTVQTLSGYVAEITAVLSALAAKDCTVRPEQNYLGDFSTIGSSLREIVRQLNDVYASIQRASGEVANGASQMENASQMLAQGAAEQASSIEELSASLAEIAHEVKDNADRAGQASQYARETNGEVLRGNEKMNQMIAAMGVISESSSEIGKIIKTIQDIAFQTNILSLNAAVEAARAGNAGRGFAVVADEVRNLANKSAAAAEDTTRLIENSVRAVQNGTKIVNETAASLNGIVEKTQQTNRLIGEISDASSDQAAAISQITGGIDQISVVVQSTSATSEQSAATSAELSSHAQLLMGLMEQIRLCEESDSMEADKSTGIDAEMLCGGRGPETSGETNSPNEAGTSPETAEADGITAPEARDKTKTPDQTTETSKQKNAKEQKKFSVPGHSADKYGPESL